LSVVHALLLQRPDAGILEIGIVVAHRGEDDRHSAVMRCGEQRGDNGDFLVEIGANHRPFVGEVGLSLTAQQVGRHFRSRRR
jgi:hypothetical protein